MGVFYTEVRSCIYVATTTRKPKQDEQKASPEPGSAVKHRLEEEADTFRGVHLDPNAHHWDEVRLVSSPIIQQCCMFMVFISDGRG